MGARDAIVVAAAGCSTLAAGLVDLPIRFEVGAALLFGVCLAIGVSRLGAPGEAAELAAEATFGPVLEELERSRRYGHSCAVIRLAGAGGNRDGLRRDLRVRLRVTDRSWHDGTDAWVLLPECDRAGAERYFGRLADDIPGVAALIDGSMVAVASFPEDALTSGGLMDVLYGVAKHAPNEAVVSRTPIPFRVVPPGMGEAAG